MNKLERLRKLREKPHSIVIVQWSDNGIDLSGEADITGEEFDDLLAVAEAAQELKRTNILVHYLGDDEEQVSAKRTMEATLAPLLGESNE